MPKPPEKWSWTIGGRGKCHSCMNGFKDGRRDCGVTSCELYPRMPFRKLEPNYWWMLFNPKKNGYVDWNGKEYTDSELAAWSGQHRTLNDVKEVLVSGTIYTTTVSPADEPIIGDW